MGVHAVQLVTVHVRDFDQMVASYPMSWSWLSSGSSPASCTLVARQLAENLSDTHLARSTGPTRSRSRRAAGRTVPRPSIRREAVPAKPVGLHSGRRPSARTFEGEFSVVRVAGVWPSAECTSWLPAVGAEGMSDRYRPNRPPDRERSEAQEIGASRVSSIRR